MGQQTNPFELQDSDLEDKAMQVDTAPVHVQQIQESEDAQRVNPFEIDSDKDLIIQESIELEELPASKNSIPSNNTPSTNNPFEISNSSSSSAPKEPSEPSAPSITDDQTPSVRLEQEMSDLFLRNKEKSTQSNNFVFWIALISGLLISILLSGNRGIIQKILKGLRNGNYMNLFQKEEKNGFSNSFGLLYLIFLLNFAAFFSLVLRNYNLFPKGQMIWYSLIFVFIVLLVQHISFFLLNYISNAQKNINAYYFVIILINSTIGLILIPINLLIAFGPAAISANFVKIGIIIIVLSLILRWIRGFVISLRLIVADSFHFFLYLCSLEILPLFLIARLLMDVM